MTANNGQVSSLSSGAVVDLKTARRKEISQDGIRYTVEQIFFVRDDSTFDKEHQLLDKAFSMLQQKKIIPKWITASEVQQQILSTDTTIMFIVHPFEGPAYKHLRSLKCMIVSPRAIIEGLQKNVNIVDNLSRPLANLALSDCFFCITNADPKDKKEAIKRLTMMAGRYHLDMVKECNVLLANSVLAPDRKVSSKYMAAFSGKRNVKVVYLKFLEEAWTLSESGIDVDVDYLLNKHKLPIFAGLSICCTGLPTDWRKEITTSVPQNGGEFKANFEFNTCTFLIAGKPEETDWNNPKLRKAIQKAVPILKYQWIQECLQRGYCVDWRNFVMEEKSQETTESVKSDNVKAVSGGSRSSDSAVSSGSARATSTPQRHAKGLDVSFNVSAIPPAPEVPIRKEGRVMLPALAEGPEETAIARKTIGTNAGMIPVVNNADQISAGNNFNMLDELPENFANYSELDIPNLESVARANIDPQAQFHWDVGQLQQAIPVTNGGPDKPADQDAFGDDGFDDLCNEAFERFSQAPNAVVSAAVAVHTEVVVHANDAPPVVPQPVLFVEKIIIPSIAQDPDSGSTVSAPTKPPQKGAQEAATVKKPEPPQKEAVESDIMKKFRILREQAKGKPNTRPLSLPVTTNPPTHPVEPKLPSSSPVKNTRDPRGFVYCSQATRKVGFGRQLDTDLLREPSTPSTASPEEPTSGESTSTASEFEAAPIAQRRREFAEPAAQPIATTSRSTSNGHGRSISKGKSAEILPVAGTSKATNGTTGTVKGFSKSKSKGDLVQSTKKNTEAEVVCISEDEDPAPVRKKDTRQEPVIMLSGFTNPKDKAYYFAQMKQIKVDALDKNEYDERCTHLVLDNMSRNEKYLACVAAGKWVLHVPFLKDSFEHGQLMPPEMYELGNMKTARSLFELIKKPGDQQMAKAAYYWRNKVAQDGKRAFHGWKVIILCAEQRLGGFVRLIQAGHGVVAGTSFPYNGDIKTLTHVIYEKSNPIPDSELVKLKNTKVRIEKCDYLQAYICEEPFARSSGSDDSQRENRPSVNCNMKRSSNEELGVHQQQTTLKRQRSK